MFAIFEACGILFAVLSSLFAALTSILAKVGIENVNSNLATAIRTMVVLGMSWLMVLVTHSGNGILEISKKSWLFLILSGLATGASWLCYYKALQLGEASKVVPIDKMSVIGLCKFLSVKSIIHEKGPSMVYKQKVEFPLPIFGFATN